MENEIKSKKKRSQYIITSAKVLSNTEAASLRALCNRFLGIERDARNALIILLSLECGLRATEALRLAIGDFDFGKKPTVYIRSLKGSNARVLPIRKALADAVEVEILKKHPDTAHIKNLPKDELVFGISYSRLEQVWRMMRPNPQKSFHSLRHTFAVETFLKNKDVLFLQRALGHRQISNTLVYTDFLYSNTTMRDVMVVGE